MFRMSDLRDWYYDQKEKARARKNRKQSRPVALVCDDPVCCYLSYLCDRGNRPRSRYAMASSTIKDLALIGAVGAAGYLGFKMLSGKLGNINLPINLGQADTQHDYEAVDKFADILAQNNAQQNALIASVLQQIGKNPTTVIYPAADNGDGSDPTPAPVPTKELTSYADTATMALEKIGAYGAVREAEAKVAQSYDTNNTAALNAVGGLGAVVGMGDAEYGIVEDLASGAGLAPGAAGTVATLTSFNSNIWTGNVIGQQRGVAALAEGVKSVGEDVYNVGKAFVDFWTGFF